MSADQEGLEFAGALRRFRLPAAAWIDERCRESGVAVADPARAALVLSLRARLCGCAHTALDAERRSVPGRSTAALVAELQDDAAWARFLAGYPVVARLLDTSFATWKRRVASLLANLARDGGDLGASRPAIAEIQSHGERLEARRSTLSLRLADGARWVYREKDLSAAAWFMEVVARLNAAGLSVPLHVRAVHVRPGRSWDELVAAGPCRDDGEIHRYFVRAGLLLRLLERLGAADFHMRNVLAAGEYPVLTDIETLFHPYPPSPTPAARALLRSPLRSGLLALWVFGELGHRAAYAGGLNPGGVIAMPFRLMRARTREDRDGGLEGFFGYVTAAPTLPAPIGRHVDEIVAGYLEMDELLAGSPDVFGLLARARDLPVRVVGTPGMVYENALLASLEPALLRSEAARDAWLARLPLRPHETAVLRDLVVPRPGALVGAHPALASEGPAAPGERARRIDLLCTAAALVDDGPARARAAPAPPPSPIAAAVAIGDAIVAEAYPGPEWLGVSWMPWAGIRFIGALPGDLLSGRAGLGLVLAYLFRVTRLPRFRDAALAALGTVPATLDVPRFIGGYCGLGGEIYALARSAELLEDPALARRARTFLGMFPRGPLAAGPWDVVTGVAGFLLGALALGEAPRDAVDALRAAWERGLPVPPHVAGGLPAAAPDQETGVAHVLGRVARHVGGGRAGAPVPPRGHLLWRLGADPGAPAEAARRLAGRGGDLLDELDLTLTAYDATRDASFLVAARERADAMIERRRRLGLWLPDTRVAERHNLSAMTGLAALAHAFLRLEAPGDVRSLRRLE